jgi:hypothetical protein
MSNSPVGLGSDVSGEGAPGVGRETPPAGPEQAAGQPASAQQNFVQRLIGVLRLDGAVYLDIAADPAATGQAVVVVAAAAVARSLAAAGGPFGSQGIAFAVQTALLWPVVACLVWILALWFGHPTSLGRLARVLGFAMAPFVLSALGVVPVTWIAAAANFVATALLIAAFWVAVRNASGVSAGMAALVCVIVVLVIAFGFMAIRIATTQA